MGFCCQTVDTKTLTENTNDTLNILPITELKIKNHTSNNSSIGQEVSDIEYGATYEGESIEING